MRYPYQERLRNGFREPLPEPFWNFWNGLSVSPEPCHGTDSGARTSRMSPIGPASAQVGWVLRTCAGHRGWIVVGEEADRITCDPKRRKKDPPGLVRAIKLIGQGQANLLAIFGADRLVAEPVALLQLVARIKDLGGMIASYRDGRNLVSTGARNRGSSVKSAVAIGWGCRAESDSLQTSWLFRHSGG